jgi:hypothetical protein
VAGRGPAPKDPATRRRRNVDPVPTTVVSEDGKLRGPELPGGFPWPEQTRSWWGTWRSSAQSQTFTASDWDFLLDTALLHAQLWSGNHAAATELRLRVAKFGATPEDRARLRMHVRHGEPAPQPDQGPAELAEAPASRYGHLRSVKQA